MPPNMPITITICNIPRPTIDITVNRMSSPGKASQASTSLCTTMSYLPPKNPKGRYYCGDDYSDDSCRQAYDY